jgi:hypothetical protein
MICGMITDLRAADAFVTEVALARGAPTLVLQRVKLALRAAVHASALVDATRRAWSNR